MASSAAAASASLGALMIAILALLSPPAAARPGIPFHPCNTLLITYTVSTTTITTTSSADEPAAPRHYRTGFVSIYRIISPFRISAAAAAAGDADADADGHLMPRRPSHLAMKEIPRPASLPPAIGFSSLEERAKDILVVVVGLLFGVGCGALTAATMYLVWSLVLNRYEEEDDGDEFEDVDSLKKAGYIKIPAAETTTKPAKEGYEGN